MSADRAKDRAKGLDRIARVQAQMVRLAELRLAVADREIAALAEDRARLADYAAGAAGLGEALAKSALRSMLSIDRRAAEVERARGAEQDRLAGLKRRDRALAATIEAVAAKEKRVAEAAEQAVVMEAWLALRF